MTELKTPVLFLVFNRPDTTKRVFERIREVRPPRLYIAADGPRENRKGEVQKCEQVREIVTNVDWDCKLKTFFRDKNLGCKDAVSGGIDWFFKNEEMGIILEDDCLPNIDFFLFCEILLHKFKNEDQIMHIGGTNPIAQKQLSNSYYFSNYNRIWGWATWRKSWEKVEFNKDFWIEIKKSDRLKSIFNDREYEHWCHIFDKVYSGQIDTWDYQWFLSRLVHGLAIIPNVNLVKNIGFSEEATHTTNTEHHLANMKYGKLTYPINHPENIKVNEEMDEKWSKYVLETTNENVIKKLKKILQWVKG
jgi:hypothetical protein